VPTGQQCQQREQQQGQQISRADEAAEASERHGNTVSGARKRAGRNVNSVPHLRAREQKKQGNGCDN
jgi:hypothetical protein